MADNRANASGSKLIEGVHRTDTKSSQSNYIDPKTIKEINVAYNGISKFAKMLGLNLEKYNEVILESAKKQVSTRQDLDKKSKELDKQLDEMRKHYFGKNKKIADDFEKQIELQKRNLENEFDESAVKLRKELIKQSFKNVTTNKSVKIFNSKYANASGLKSAHNSYLSDLEQLKSNALDTFGEGFQSNKEYKKALLRMNREYESKVFDTMISDFKENFKKNHKILSGIGEGIKDTFDRNKDALMGILGPINLIIAPLKDFFGGFGKIFKFIGGGIKTLFGKFTKKVPTVNDVVKTGAVGVGSLYLANEIKKLFGGGKDEGLKGGLKLPQGFAEIFSENSSFMKNAKLLSSMGGGLMVVADFVSEFAKTGDWRSATVKGLTGNSKLENAIKGALLGFGIGGPIGALVGALGGVALNYFSPQVEKFIRTMTGDVSQKKKNILENIKKDVSKGKRDQTELDIYEKLATSGMSDADFASLGKGLIESEKENRKDWIRQLSNGNLDLLNNDELNYMANLFMKGGYNVSNSIGVDKFKSTMKLLGEIGNDLALSNVMSSQDSTASFLKTIMMLYNSKDKTGQNLDSFLKQTGLDKTQYDKLMNSNIMKSLMSNSDYVSSVISMLGVLDANGKIKVKNSYFSDLLNISDVDDAIIRSDGSIIRTNPQDTLIALKDINNSMDMVRADTVRSLNNSINNLGGNDTLDKRLNVIIEVLSKILDKDVKITMPQQTRYDLDLIMNGGMI